MSRIRNPAIKNGNIDVSENPLFFTTTTVLISKKIMVKKGVNSTRAIKINPRITLLNLNTRRTEDHARAANRKSALRNCRGSLINE